MAWLAALTGQARVSIAYGDAELAAQAHGLENWLSAMVPLNADIAPGTSQASLVQAVGSDIAACRVAGPCPRDLRLRLGERQAAPLRIGLALAPVETAGGFDLLLACHANGQLAHWRSLALVRAPQIEQVTRTDTAPAATAIDDHTTVASIAGNVITINGGDCGGLRFAYDVTNGRAMQVSRLSERFESGGRAVVDFKHVADPQRVTGVNGTNLRVPKDTAPVGRDAHSQNQHSPARAGATQPEPPQGTNEGTTLFWFDQGLASGEIITVTPR